MSPFNVVRSRNASEREVARHGTPFRDSDRTRPTTADGNLTPRPRMSTQPLAWPATNRTPHPIFAHRGGSLARRLSRHLSIVASAPEPVPNHRDGEHRHRHCTQHPPCGCAINLTVMRSTPHRLSQSRNLSQLTNMPDIKKSFRPVGTSDQHRPRHLPAHDVLAHES